MGMMVNKKTFANFYLFFKDSLRNNDIALKSYMVKTIFSIGIILIQNFPHVSKKLFDALFITIVK